MFGAFKGIGLGKREERGLVRTTILRRWGTPQNAPDIPGERPKPWSRRRSRAPAGGRVSGFRHSNYRRAMLRRCSLFDIPGSHWLPGASVCLERGFSGPLMGSPQNFTHC